MHYKRLSFVCFLLTIFASNLLLANPPLVLFTLFLAYGLSGYVAWLWKWLNRGREPKRQQDLF